MQNPASVLNCALTAARKSKSQQVHDVPEQVMVGSVDVANVRRVSWQGIQKKVNKLTLNRGGPESIEELKESLISWLKGDGGGDIGRGGGSTAMGSGGGSTAMGSGGGMVGMGSIDMKKLGEYVFAQAKAGAQAGMEEQQKKAPLALGNGGVQDSLTAVRKEVQKLNKVKDAAVMDMGNGEYEMVLEAAVQYVIEKQPRHVMRCAVQRMLDENREEVKEHAAKRARLGDKEKELESEEDEDDESEEESSEEEEE